MEPRTFLYMERLIHLLKKVDSNPENFMVDNTVDDVDSRQYDVTHPVIRDIIQYATEYLTVGPDVHFCREIVHNAGYTVYPGEVDSFGWLSAYFQMKKGILLFG